MRTQAYTNAYSRVWFQNGGAGPSKARTYHGNWKAGAVSWDRGDITTIREPDPNQYGKFIAVGKFRGEPGDPELPITARYSLQRSDLLRAAKGDCEHALHVHMGQCANPQDFARGWEKVLILEGATITSYGTGDLGALGPDENAAINEDVPFQGTDFYEVTRMTFAEQAATQVVGEMRSIYVCDSQQCGQCGVESDGCQIVLAVQAGNGTDRRPTVFFTRDGGSTWGTSAIEAAAFTASADEIICVGPYTFVLSSDTDTIYYADTAALVSGTATWAEITAGIVATHGPVAASSSGVNDVWLAGLDGYIYHADDLLSGVDVSSAGSATTDDLVDIHAFDMNNIVAVGANNAVVRTNNGGQSWSLIAGPAAGVALNSVWVQGESEWLVGTADGRLFYTVDAGVTWTQKRFSGDGAGAVRDIVFSRPSVGYMAHNTAAPAGRILRTIDGGYSWYVMPESAGNIPVNDYVSSLAVCDDPNVVFGAGLGGNGTDGFLVKGA